MKHRILVVDDDAPSREGLADILELSGFEAAQASNGEEALKYLSQGGSAHVILLDLMMPVMDGWTFRRAQLRDPWLADIPVIAISGLGARPLRGAKPVVAFRKPIQVNRLLETLSLLCPQRARHITPRGRTP